MKRRITLLAAAAHLVALSFTLQASPPAHAPISASDIIRRSVEANDRDWRAAPQYSYMQRTRDSDGTRTEQVIMLFGTPYTRLISVNGKPLSKQEEERQQHKFDGEVSRRRAESPGETADRIANYEKDRRGDHLLMQQLTEAFDFRLTGQMHLAGRDVYTLRATPRAGYYPPNLETRVLKGMKGQLWIDQDSFQWVKVSAQVISPVSIAGFLATVQPGTYFELEKTPAEGEIWLPHRFRMESHSKVLLFFHHSTQEDDTYFDYRKTPEQYLPRTSQ